jgi:hypothetical protein
MEIGDLQDLRADLGTLSDASAAAHALTMAPVDVTRGLCEIHLQPQFCHIFDLLLPDDVSWKDLGETLNLATRG